MRSILSLSICGYGFNLLSLAGEKRIEMQKDKLGFFEYKEVIYGFLNELILNSIDSEKKEEILYSLWNSYYASDIREISIKRDAKVLETTVFFISKG